MLKAVFRPSELIALPDKIAIEAPTSFPDLAHLAPEEEVVEALDDIEEYTGPTADDLRREAEMFKAQWEEEKERMFSAARTEADNIIADAQKAAFTEVKRQTDESQVMKQQAEEEAQRIIADAQNKAAEIENETRQSMEAESKETREKGRQEGHEEGYGEGKAEVDRLIERTQVVLERAQEKRGEILKETEKQIVDLVLLIARKVVKVISENQKEIIIYNVLEALRKVKAKGDIIVKVNLDDLKLATEHKQDFISQMESSQKLHIMEDSTVDRGGCIIETDFGEIDARISSQLAELENKILEISPVRSNIKDNTPVPIVRTANLNADLAASSKLLEAADAANAADMAKAAEALKAADEEKTAPSMPTPADNPFAGVETSELSPAASAALTASAALAALATMGTKGRRETDKKLQIT